MGEVSQALMVTEQQVKSGRQWETSPRAVHQKALAETWGRPEAEAIEQEVKTAGGSRVPGMMMRRRGRIGRGEGVQGESRRAAASLVSGGRRQQANRRHWHDW